MVFPGGDGPERTQLMVLLKLKTSELNLRIKPFLCLDESQQEPLNNRSVLSYSTSVRHGERNKEIHTLVTVMCTGLKMSESI